MHGRTTAVLTIVVALLGLVYYAYDVRGREAATAARIAEQRVLNFDPGAVRELTIEKAGEQLVVRGKAGHWRIVSPEETPAEAATIDGLLSFIGRLEKVRSLEGESGGDLREFGLDLPRIRLRVGLHDGQALTLLIGETNPTGTGVYAKVQGVRDLFLAPPLLARELSKSPYLDEIRDKSLVRVELDRVRRLEIERADTRIAATRVGDHRWHLERPWAGWGDDGIIRDLLWKIGAARARTVLRRPPGWLTHDLERPHALVRVVDERGGRQTLTLVQDGSDRAALYVRVEGRPEVYVTDSQLLTDVSISPRALRNRQLLTFDGREAQRLTLRYPRETLVLERVGKGWAITEPVDAEPAQGLVDNLLEVLPNIRYIAVESPGPDELGAYGLDHPQLQVTVALRGGRELPTLAVGGRRGTRQFAMLGGRAPVYTVDARLIRVFPQDPAEAARSPLPEQLKRGVDRE